MYLIRELNQSGTIFTHSLYTYDMFFDNMFHNILLMYNIIRSWLHDNSQFSIHTEDYLDGLVQEKRNYSALAMELRLSCTKPSILA